MLGVLGSVLPRGTVRELKLGAVGMSHPSLCGARRFPELGITAEPKKDGHCGRRDCKTAIFFVAFSTFFVLCVCASDNCSLVK